MTTSSEYSTACIDGEFYHGVEPDPNCSIGPLSPSLAAFLETASASPHSPLDDDVFLSTPESNWALAGEAFDFHQGMVLEPSSPESASSIYNISPQLELVDAFSASFENELLKMPAAVPAASALALHAPRSAIHAMTPVHKKNLNALRAQNSLTLSVARAMQDRHPLSGKLQDLACGVTNYAPGLKPSAGTRNLMQLSELRDHHIPPLTFRPTVTEQRRVSVASTDGSIIDFPVVQDVRGEAAEASFPSSPSPPPLGTGVDRTDGHSPQGGQSPGAFVCSTCNRVFDQIHKLNHHKRYHERPHECSYQGCHMKFGTKTHLDRHINDKHIKSRKIYCIVPDCPYSRMGGKSFPRKDNWRRHMLNKHGLTHQSEPGAEFMDDMFANEDDLFVSMPPDVQKGEGAQGKGAQGKGAQGEEQQHYRNTQGENLMTARAAMLGKGGVSKKYTECNMSYTISDDHTNGAKVRQKRLCALDIACGPKRRKHQAE